MTQLNFNFIAMFIITITAAIIIISTAIIYAKTTTNCYSPYICYYYLILFYLSLF